MRVNAAVPIRNQIASFRGLPSGIILAAADVDALRSQIEELEVLAQAILDTAENENDRDLTDEEADQVNAYTVDIEKKSARLSTLERLHAARPKSAGRRSDPEPTQENGRRVPAQARLHDPRRGFQSFGQFAQAVRMAALGQSEHDGVKRLMAAATTYSNEGTGADGGFAVPPEFRREIVQKVMGENNLTSRTDQITTGSNNFTIPTDETTPWQSTGGIQAFWEGEGQPITPSKVGLGQKSIRLNKLTALVPVSDELLDDAPGLESYLRAKAPLKLVSKINTAVIGGTGVGQPLGILNSPSLITVAKELSQPADTVWFANVSKMWSRLYAEWRANAVWLISQTVEQQLDQMAFDPQATAGKVPIYLPANSVSGSPFAILKGRPVIPMQACPILGDVGDMILTDLRQYLTLTRGQDIKTDVSIHLYFDQALTTFRFILRMAGQPWWAAPIEPQQSGADTLSWAVAIAERT